MTKLVFFLFISITFTAVFTSATTISGKIYDEETNQPVSLATIIVVDHAQSILANEDGYFRINLPEGHYNLKFTHVAYYSLTKEFDVDDTEIETDIYLKPATIELPAIKVYDRNYDAAQRIIIEAIKRKDEILSALKSYDFDAYTKLVIRNTDTSKTDSTNMMLITETQVKAFWEYPDRYKEIITARKQSANIDAAGNMVSVGKILNFNSNRIDFGEQSIVSPTAKDALDHYNYYLLDTLMIDSLPVFLLEVEPKNNTTPLFQGTIQIADSSYAVVGVDLTFNAGFDNPYISSFDLKQEFQQFQNKYWMPTVIKYDGIVNIPFPGIPTFSFDYTAALHQFHFEPEHQDTVFNEYVLEVDNNADDYDSTQWYANQLIPLSEMEQVGYHYIDSMENNKPLYKKLLPLLPAAVYVAGYAQDFFHFNRVEGAYIGGKYSFDRLDYRLSFDLKTGYAFDADFWQHRYGFHYTFDRQTKLKFGAQYYDEVRTQNTIISKPNGNSTLISLFEKTDPYNYHREKGYSLSASIKPFHHTVFSITYHDNKQYSMTNHSDYSLFSTDTVYRENLPIPEGKLRSLSAKIQYDSSNLMKLKGKESKFRTYPYTSVTIGAEKADPSFIENDYTFTQLYAALYTERRVMGIGIGKLFVFGGKAITGQLPPQKYFTVDYGAEILGYAMTFKTFDKTNFSGTRVLCAYYNQDFGSMLFKKSGLPYIKDIPFSLSLNAGIFWADQKKNYYPSAIDYFNQTDNPYSEIGFGIGRLPFLVKLYFTWQLSDYDTNKFNFGFDLSF